MGRPKKSGERYPSGDLKPGNEGPSPALLGRMKNEYLKKLAEPALENRVGQLLIGGHLTTVQAAAALKIGEIYHRWHRCKRLRTSAKSPNLEQGFSGAADLAEERMTGDELEALESAIHKAQAEFDQLQKQLEGLPRNARHALEDVCVSGLVVNSMILPDLRILLDRLAVSFGPKWRQAGKNRIPQIVSPVQSTPAPSFTLAPRRGDPARKAAEMIVRRLKPEVTEDEIRTMSEAFVEERALQEAKTARDSFREQKARKHG